MSAISCVCARPVRLLAGVSLLVLVLGDPGVGRPSLGESGLGWPRPALLRTAAAAEPVSPAAVPDSAGEASRGAVTLDPVVVTSGRLGAGLPGASVTVLTADDIRRSPARTIPDVLAGVPGVQVRDLYGNKTAAGATIDIRGFGATAAQNTLVLLNGRRLNDLDLSAVDFSTIPLAEVERIEVTRGSAAAVLYGDGAVGGAINIITRTPVADGSHGRIEAGFGSYGFREVSGRADTRSGAYSLLGHGRVTRGGVWRRNNRVLERTVTTEIRHDGDGAGQYLRLALEDQSSGLPGGRRVTPTASERATDPRGTSTPFDQADQNSVNAVLGGTLALGDHAELVLDGGVRRKVQEARFISSFSSLFDAWSDATLTTWSLTPRLNLSYVHDGVAHAAMVGADVYRSAYDSNRRNADGASPIHVYRGEQLTVAGYLQDTVRVGEALELSAGVRGQGVWFEASDRFDPQAPGALFETGLADHDSRSFHTTMTLGGLYHLTPAFDLVARAGRGLRLPTLDERIGTRGAAFDLRAQTSQDLEGGVRYHTDAVTVSTSAFVMEVQDEIAYDPLTFVNTNLDPTRRLGVEAEASLHVFDGVDLTAGLTWTDARFVSGPQAGHDVPLVARWTAAGGVSWQVLDTLTAAAAVTWTGPRRFDNDQANQQVKMPGMALVDLKLTGRLGPVEWTAQVDNLFDHETYAYGIASTSQIGTYSVYPLPGRTFLLRAGVAF